MQQNKIVSWVQGIQFILTITTPFLKHHHHHHHRINLKPETNHPHQNRFVKINTSRLLFFIYHMHLLLLLFVSRRTSKPSHPVLSRMPVSILKRKLLWILCSTSILLIHHQILQLPLEEFIMTLKSIKAERYWKW